MQSATVSQKHYQQQFIESIFNPDKSHTNSDQKNQDGLNIYRTNLLFTATRALLVTYPVLNQLIGEEAIRYLARELLRIAPPSSGDWGEWGQQMDSVLVTSALTDTYPFLADVARLEWAIHQTGRCAIQPIAMQSLALIQAEDILQTRIQLSPCIYLLESDFPVDIIWHAHQPDHETGQHDKTALANALAQRPGKSRMLVYQQNQLPQLIPLSELEFQWFSDVANEKAVSELLDKYPQLDFVDWLAKAIELDWISDLKKVSPHQ